MSMTIIRSALPIIAIAGAVLYGLNEVLLTGRAQQVATVRARLQQAREKADAEGTLRGAKSDIEARLAECRAQLSRTRERSRAATSQRELFERLTALAHDTNIELDQLRALEWKTPGAEQGALAASACGVSVVATFADLADFVGRLETDLGFTAVTRLRVKPASSGDRVEAELELACFAATTAAAPDRQSRAMEDGR